MPIQWTSNPQKSWPDGADGVSVAPSGSANVFGSWVEIVASTSADSVLTGLVLRTSSTANLAIDIQIGVGAAAAESAIATFPGSDHGGGATSDFNDVQWCLAIPVDLIPSGSRVAARIRVNTTATTAYLVAPTYYEKPITGNLTISTQPVQGLSVVNLTTASGTPWAFGTWTQLVASTSTEQVIDGIAVMPTGNTQFELQFGVGAAAAESPVALFRGHGGITGAWGYLPQMLPLDVIGSGVRVSARVRSNIAAQQVYVGYTYREKPL